VGILGSNGSGKSSLLKVLIGQQKPSSGTITHADALKISYFDQTRESLDPDLSILKTLCPVGDYIDFAGKHIHIRSYLDRFLFSGAQAEMPIGRLSGGEQSRVLLAKLMLRPANVLVLDEPTNDLDMSTLNMLEEVLTEFQGAVIIVSHDRYFLDNVSEQILAFDSFHKFHTFSELSQWELWRESQIKAAININKSKERPRADKKLGYKELRELESMEANILEREAKIESLQSEMALSEVQSNANRLMEITQSLNSLQLEVEKLYLRWAELEKRK
jgi:ATP-binding cassette subfamily F protein uup